MSVLSAKALTGQIKSIGGNSSKLKVQIQEALISCAYYAAKDGNTDPYNLLLKAVGSSTRIKGLTMWGESYGFVQVKNEEFVLNKSQRKEANVTSEADFVQIEIGMRAAPMWCDLVAKEKAASMFDASDYLDHVILKLEKEGASTAKAFLIEAVEKYKKANALIALRIESLGEATL